MNGQRMRHQPRWFGAAILPLALGVVWLVLGWDSGVLAGALICIPGVILVSSGCAMLLWPGDRLISHHMALAAAASLVLALLLSPWLGWLATPALLLASMGAFLAAGLAAIYQNPVSFEVPEPATTARLAYKAATDEALLGWFVTAARIPHGDAVERDRRELDALASIAANRGWAQAPQQLHQTPGVPANERLQRSRSGGRVFEWLTFDSGFAVDPDLPGAERWATYRRNQRMAARVFCHPGRARPWLMCIHGYRMGVPRLDLSLFDVARLHRQLGFNLIMPILPLHGSRRASWLNGGLFLDGPLVDLLHAESQALWDLRRCLAWVHKYQPGQPVGVLGYSLGGYNAALMAAFEPELAFVVAGIPLTDIPAALWRHMPSVHTRFLETQGIEQHWLSDLLAPVSPLHQKPSIARERRYIFAATADQLVPPEQPLRLWHHWERPLIHWYHGSHLSVRHEASIAPFVANAFAHVGFTAPNRA